MTALPSGSWTTVGLVGSSGSPYVVVVVWPSGSFTVLAAVVVSW